MRSGQIFVKWRWEKFSKSFLCKKVQNPMLKINKALGVPDSRHWGHCLLGDLAKSPNLSETWVSSTSQSRQVSDTGDDLTRKTCGPSVMRWLRIQSWMRTEDQDLHVSWQFGKGYRGFESQTRRDLSQPSKCSLELSFLPLCFDTYVAAS